MVRDIIAGSGSSFAFTQPMVVHQDHLYFRANNGGFNLELFKSDGTAAGTVLVKDITAG